MQLLENVRNFFLHFGKKLGDLRKQMVLALFKHKMTEEKYG